MPDQRIIPELLLFTTTDAASDRGPALERMIASVERFRETAGFPVRLCLLRQRASGIDDSLARWIEQSWTDRQIPLSAARNHLLAETRFDGDAIIAFPDDDAWYPAATLPWIAAIFRENATLDFWFCGYAGKPVAEPVPAARPATLRQVIAKASSNTIFLSARLVKTVGAFDEDLGLGTRNDAAEDTEFAIRAFHRSLLSLFHDQALVGHRDASKAIRARYFRGGLIALHRNRHLSFGMKWQTARKLLVGIALVVRGELKPSALLAAIREARVGTPGRDLKSKPGSS